MDDPNALYDRFVERLKPLFDEHFPVKQKSIKKLDLNKPYIDRSIATLIQEKHRLQRLFNRYPLTYGDEFRSCRNRVTKLVREAKHSYYQEKLENNVRDSKKTWSVVNEVLGRSRVNSSVSELEDGGEVTRDTGRIAQLMNEYFANVGAQLGSKFEDEIGEQFGGFLRYMPNNILSDFKFSPIDQTTLEKLILDLKSSSPGFDSIPMSIYKDNITLLSSIILYICNVSLLKGVFPKNLSIAKVICIHKSGDPKSCSNYRPISILPAFSKILEKIVSVQLTEYFNAHSLFSSAQYGFRSSFSTENALHEIVDRLYSAFDSNHFGVGIFLDLAKAFDSLDRRVLYRKLACYGITGVEGDWFRSYFANRQQYAVCGNSESTMLPVNFGVAQGSIIGPLLFIIFINDIVHCSTELRFIVYADDTNVFMSSQDMESLMHRVNVELEKVRLWFISNRLTLNSGKSQFMLFHRKRRTVPDRVIPVNIGGVVIERVQQTKFLGVQIDCNLTWEAHTAYVVRKLSKFIPILYRCREQMTNKCLILLYNSLIYPNLIYCNTIWGSSTKVALTPVHQLQKKIIRIISGTHVRARDHTAPLYRALGFLDISQINMYMSGIYVFKSLNNLSPCNWFHLYEGEYNTRFSAQSSLLVPFVRTTHSRQSIRFVGSNVWNMLPLVIKTASNYNSFKISLKRFMLN
jgi:retron-type reverse transcriptase